MFIQELSAFFIVKAIAVGLSQYCILKAIYNIFLHPLRNYPGPRIMAASRLPITYANIMGQSSHWTFDLHEKYGPVVRMAPDELSYADSSAWRDIYASHPTRPAGMARNPAFYQTFDDKSTIPSLLNASNSDHSRIHRAYARAFSKQAVAEHEPLIIEHINRLIRKLYQQQHQPIDIVDMFTFTVADITVDLQFGEPLHILNDTTHQPWVRSLFGLLKSGAILATLAEFPIIKAIFQLTLSRLVKRARDFYFGWMNAMLDHRLATKTNRPDIVNFVMEQNRPQASISEAELRASVPVVILAQSETSATVLSGLVAHLLDAPHVFQQLQDEVRSTFQQTSDINMAAIGQMRVLNACIKETLRIYPGVPGFLPRVVPPGGANISGGWVPGGIRVYISPLATFRSSANFHDPNSFLPHRWYTETDDKFSMDDKGALKPFSIGSRECVGKHMANYIMGVVICGVMLHFDFEPCTESKAWFSKQRIWSGWEKRPLMVKLTTAKPRA